DGLPYKVRGRFERDSKGDLIPDAGGIPFRLWRPALDPALNPDREAFKGIARPDDIWNEIIKVAQVPGCTSAPKLQPIAARIVMLQSGMRAPMGIKVSGPNLDAIQEAGMMLEQILKTVPSVSPETVYAERIVGKPYLEIQPDRKALALYGLKVKELLGYLEASVGGMKVTTTVEDRERYPVVIRYPREMRNDIDTINRISIPTPGGAQLPLSQLASIAYVRGPDMIKSEDTRLTGYVIFDKLPAFAEVDVVEQAKDEIQRATASGILKLPEGVTWKFAGSYENQVRSEKRLKLVLPLALFVIFMILYLQFASVATTLIVFSGILVAWSGGFIMIWLYAQPWFLNFSLFGADLRSLFQIHPINLSVAVWVGFLALFGIASDDGVVMATYLDQAFSERKPSDKDQVRSATMAAGIRRIKPCLMTTATTVLALLPVLTSTGRGADIMIPMAIPSFGGMVIEVMTMLTVPVLYCLARERGRCLTF
ncbi:MAG: efflux RND transporter permease subunit, partial [Candidatus Wallbacteria bacterium]|nr:efflux RND transporter permease subunit [Candidatus Wallbacteria bacterium]